MSYTDSPAQYYLKYSPLDIAALQYFYGSSKTSRTGDDTYQLSKTAPNLIWDGDGIDTIDARQLTQGGSIYLSPGYWGFEGAAKADKITSPGQITVNFGTVIENVIGSYQDDHLYGNDVANKLEGSLDYDTLFSGMGNDTLDGGEGTDSAKWNYAASQFQLLATPTGWKLTDKTGSDGTDSLTNIEKIQFTDRSVIIESQSHGSYANLPTELYQFFITAFNAAPGVTYMNQLVEAYRYGFSIKRIVDVFTTKSQFTDAYAPSLSYSDLATQLVNNIAKQFNNEITLAKYYTETLCRLGRSPHGFQWRHARVLWQFSNRLLCLSQRPLPPMPKRPRAQFVLR